MQQRFRKVALFVGAVSIVGGGLIMVACGSDSTSPTPTPGIDAAKGDTSVPDVDSSTEDTGTGDGGTDPDCGKNPKLRDFTGSFRCAFLADGGVDGGEYCANDQSCCETADKVGTVYQPTYCAADTKATLPNDPATACQAGAAAAGSTFMTGEEWECADKNGCPGITNPVCCMIPSPTLAAGKTFNIGLTAATNKNHPQACGVQYVYNEGGSRCRSGACNAADIKLCSLSDNNCGAGTTCTPFVDFQDTNRGFCK